MKIQLSLNIKQPGEDTLPLFTEGEWVKIFPYCKVSAAWTHDNKPFWTYSDFMESVKYINNHEKLKGFCNSGDYITDRLELASFLGNFHQETGDPSIEAPYPWSYPKNLPVGDDTDGPAGGGFNIIEGVSPQMVLGDDKLSYVLKSANKLTDQEKDIIKTSETVIRGYVSSLVGVNQPGFGLGTGTGGGAVFQDGLCAVSDNGTLWGNDILPKPSVSDRRYACLGPYCQYGGRGAIQLSYNYNYTYCSKDLFGDMRLVQYPNLITTTDRKKFNGKPFYFGFPGVNPDGDNQLPKDIEDTTPPARQLAFITSLWFWMSNRSGRKISCNYSMKNWRTHGITSCNLIVNNQSGEIPGSWASKKIDYYRRICKIFKIPEDIVEQSIVFPAHKDAIL